MSEEIRQFQIAWNLSGLAPNQLEMDGQAGPLTNNSAALAAKKLNVSSGSPPNFGPLTEALRAYRESELSMCSPRTLDLSNPFDKLVDRFKGEGKPIGVDVSSCQGTITDFKLLKIQNPWLSFGICRATQGNTFVDSSFAPNVAVCAEAGLALGVYSVISTSLDGAAQGKHAIDVMKAASANPKLFLVDFETDHDRNLDAIAARVHAFDQTVQAAYPNCVVMIYTYPGYILEFGKRFDDDDFAIATYSGQPTPAKCQITAQRTWMYQFSGWTGPINATKGNYGIRLNTTLGHVAAVDHDVALSPELIAAVR